MKAQIIKQLKGYIRFKVKDYNIYLLEDDWLCMCSIKYNRSIKTECKHIKQCKLLLNNKKITNNI